MSPRANVSAARKAQILDAAAAVFARKGFYQASMDDIVVEAGLSKGALYWYFKSKDQIITAILDRLFAPELAGLQALVTADGSARERLLQFAAMTAREMKHMLRVAPLTYEFYALAFRDKNVRKALRRYLRAYHAHLTPLVEQGIAHGEFRADDAAQVAMTLVAIGEGTLLVWIFDPKSFDLERQIVAGMTHVLDGVSVAAKKQKR